jgi:hypothetical protein
MGSKMRSLLRNFLKYLDSRFPERVVVTQTEYIALKAKVDALESIITMQRLQKMEQEINKFNVAMGFGGSIPKMGASQFQR